MIRKYCRVKENNTKLMKHIKAMVFPLVMCGCDSRTIKKAECQRIDAFELWCWRRLMSLLGLQGDPTSPSITKEISPEYSLGGLMHIKKQRHYFANKGPSSHSYGFSSSHVWM